MKMTWVKAVCCLSRACKVYWRNYWCLISNNQGTRDGEQRHNAGDGTGSNRRRPSSTPALNKDLTLQRPYTAPPHQLWILIYLRTVRYITRVVSVRPTFVFTLFVFLCFLLALENIYTFCVWFGRRARGNDSNRNNRLFCPSIHITLTWTHNNNDVVLCRRILEIIRERQLSKPSFCLPVKTISRIISNLFIRPLFCGLVGNGETPVSSASGS